MPLSNFLASKCDDVSCSEVIRALNLDDDPELEEIEERMDEFSKEASKWKKTKTSADKLVKGIYPSLSYFHVHALTVVVF